jgi:hypothetical protein
MPKSGDLQFARLARRCKRNRGIGTRRIAAPVLLFHARIPKAAGGCSACRHRCEPARRNAHKTRVATHFLRGSRVCMHGSTTRFAADVVSEMFLTGITLRRIRRVSVIEVKWLSALNVGESNSESKNR